MTRCLRVVKPGVQSLMQDLGRPGFASVGVPRGGAADVLSLTAANRLLGNRDREACLEMAIIGADVRCDADVEICLAGATLPDAAVVDAFGARTPLSTFMPTRIRAGHTLSVGRIADGLRVYLAVRGGFDVTPVMGSASTLLSAKLGGIGGGAITTGMQLSVRHPAAGEVPHVPADLEKWLRDVVRRPVLRVVEGIDVALFGPSVFEAFISTRFKVSSRSNRVGISLEAPEGTQGLSHGQSRLRSAGMASGAIELPGSGAPIILGVDHPTTGGYPVIACVIEADLPAVGQLAPGDTVGFELVSREAARAAYLERLAAFNTELPPHG